VATYVNYNGKLIPSDQPILTSINRSFRYGDGLFESIRMLNGEIPLLNQHIKRLFHGMKILNIEIPAAYTIDYFKEQIFQLARQNNITQVATATTRNARIRLTIFRDGEGLYEPKSNHPGFVIEISALSDSQFTLNKEGLIIDIFADVLKSCDQLANLKTNNALPYILAAIHKNKNHLDDCLLLNQHGRVAEAISANVFIVKNNTLITPPLSEGCVAGIMRGQILKLADRTEISASESSLTTDDLTEADELFLTNAVTGIRWVKKFRNKTYDNATAKTLINELNNIEY